MTNTEEIAHVELDLTGLACPLPVLKAQKRLRSMSSGALLLVLATDPRAPADFENFCDAQGHELLACNGETTYKILLKRK